MWMCVIPGLALFVMTLIGCDPVADPGPVATGPKGVYVVNEGTFLASNAELSYISEDRSNASGSVFSGTNPGRTLGDVAQHAQASDGKLFVVVNNSRKIEVLEAGTHRWLRTIALTRAPRAIEVVSPLRAFVTNMDSTVSVLDLSGGVVTKDIVVGTNPEGLIRYGDRLYVFNGGWGYGSTISVIDLMAENVVATIPTPPGPSYGVLGTSGLMHVLCTGSVAWVGGVDVPGAVLTIDAASGVVGDTLPLAQPANRIAADAAGDLYVTISGAGGSGVLKLTGGSSPAVVPSMLVSGSFYGIGVDRTRSELYLSLAGDFVSNGTVQVYTLSGTLVRTYVAGIGVAPNGFVFLP
jgi:YVTN family beta-propeller protein